MTPTTRLGSWASVVGGTTSPDDTVTDYLDTNAGDYDVDAICAAYRERLAALLPGSLFLSGEEFLADAGDAAIPEDWHETFREAVQGEDYLDPICEAKRWVDLRLYLQHTPDEGAPGQPQCALSDRVHYDELPRDEEALRATFEESTDRHARPVEGARYRLEARFAYPDDPDSEQPLAVAVVDFRNA